MNHHLFFVFKLLLTAGLLVGVAMFVDLSDVWNRIRTIHPGWLLAALLCMVSGYIACGVRWAWIAEGLGIEVSRRKKIQLYFLGMFASMFLPSTIGGDVVRGVLLAKREGRKGMGMLAGASVILDRLNGLFALTILITLCLLFFEWPAIWWASWLAVVGSMWGAMLLLPLLYQRLLPFVPARFEKLKSLPLLEPRFIRQWWKSLPVSFVFQAIVVQAHVFLGTAVGVEMPWPAYAIMMGLVALATIVPVSLNGFGIREAGYVGFAVYFGADAGAVTAMAALWVIVLGISSLPGAIVLWRIGGFSKLRQENPVG